ncbi:MAG: hypothetical protein HC796_08430 [Synechococcaceae cyanobacterium RL_1_2]|nr:hypothetical protein [Synechococcaceae cyanobacterium RL_1_2]
MTPEQFLTEAESLEVDQALLGNAEKFLTRLTLSSRRLLKLIAEHYDCSIEELTHQQIITWFEQDAKLKQEQGPSAGVLRW